MLGQADPETAAANERPEAARLNSMQKRELDMIPQPTVLVSAAALEANEPQFVENRGPPAAVQTWAPDAKQQELHMVPRNTVLVSAPALAELGGTTAAMPKSALVNGHNYQQPTTGFVNANQGQPMSRSYLKNSRAGSLAESRRASIFDSMSGVPGRSRHRQTGFGLTLHRPDERLWGRS